MTKDLTEAEAKEFHDSKKWEPLSFEERFAFQLYQPRLCMPFDKFHEAAEKALGRPVWTHEFAFADKIRAEWEGRADKPSMDDIINLLPAEKTILVAIGDDKNK